MAKHHLLNGNGICFCGAVKNDSIKTAFFDEGKLYNADCVELNHVNYRQHICLSCLRKANPELIQSFERTRKLRLYKASLPKKAFARKRFNANKRNEWQAQTKKHCKSVICLPWTPVIMGLIEYKPAITQSVDKPKKQKLNAKPIESNDSYVISDNKGYEIIEMNDGNDFIAVLCMGNMAMVVLKTVNEFGIVSNESLTGWIDKEQAIKEAEELMAA